MADYKKVVEMLGENPASLLELAKKWLVEWKVDFKKLLDTFHNVRKDDLLGLIAGTHEVKIKKLETNLVEKFVIFADLGEVIVPDNFDSKTWLTSFSKKNRTKFHHYHDEITDANFSNPSRILKPGDKLYVRVFKPNISGYATSGECIEFLATQNAVYTGAQGISLVWNQKRDLLPKGYWYCSFDEKERLPKNSNGDYFWPFLHASSDNDFSFLLSSFVNGWGRRSYLLCFNEITE